MGHVSMRSQLSKAIWNVYWFILAICMVFYLCLACLRVNLIQSIKGHVIFVIVLLALTLVRQFIKVTPGRKSVIFLCVATFLTRMIHYSFAQGKVTQIMDFKTVLDKAGTGDFSDKLEYYRMYLHKFLYPWLLHVLHINTQNRIIIFQCVCVTFIPLLLYLLGRRVMDEWTGFLAGFLYLIWPAQTVYISVISEEHLVAPLTLLLLWLLFSLWDQIGKSEAWKEKNTRTILFKAFGIGMLGAFCAFLKDWVSVILVATVIVCIPLLLELNARKRLLVLASLLLILLGRSCLEKGITAFAEAKLGVKSGNGVIVYQMYETLTPGVEGQYNAELQEEYMQLLRQNEYDFNKTQKEALEILWNRILADKGQMPDLLLHKAQTAYEDDYAMFWWAFYAEMTEEEYEKWKPAIEQMIDIAHYFYLVLVTAMILTVWMLRKKECIFIMLIIQGCMLVSLLVESQSRYKYSIEPIWALAIAAGMLFLADKIAKTPIFEKGKTRLCKKGEKIKTGENKTAQK